ncbi:MAG: tRNA 2-selenouridine(34) synthase MnmH [Trueperaceae bacterium]
MSDLAPERLYPAMAGAPSRRVIDVRSPNEVARGALPGAVHLMILNDEERHAVGLRYATDGQDAAIEEGRLRTVSALPQRIRAWRDAADAEPSAFLCWRGGLRSELAQRFTERSDVPRVHGGYKAVRAHLSAALEPALSRRETFVVTGPTGCGKTELLHAAAADNALLALDLEAAAEHRGSTFGAHGPQPAQATFEHRLALPLILGPEPWLLLEDESRNVGRVHLPEPVHRRVRSAPLLVLDEPLEARLHRIHREYALAPARATGERATLDRLVAAVRRLRRRLGADATETMVDALEDAHRQRAWHDPEAFRAVIVPLLTDYYDPLYRKATPTEGRTVAARGSREELLAWLHRHLPTPA